MKEKMTDNEIMRFNELLMSKINKREIQPLDMKSCKQCGWLTKSIFKRDGLNVFICNNLKSNSTMEKRDFNICSEFDYKKHFFKK